jgi:hypothetical protein
MSDDYGNLMGAGDLVAPAMGAYMAYDRNRAFLEGAYKGGMGSWAGRDIANIATGRGPGFIASAGAAGLEAGTEAFAAGGVRAAGSAAVRAAGGSLARTAASVGARVGIGAAEGIAEGAAAGSIVPGVGTLVGAAAGAIAPFILPHIPVVGAAVNKIPLIGGMLSPKQVKKQTVFAGGGGGQPNSFLQQSGGEMTSSGADYSRQNRAEYESGRGFRR